MTPERLRIFLGTRTRNPHVIERIMRLNPKGVPEGSYPRGWRVHDRQRRNWRMSARYSRGQVIRLFGRDAWERIPRVFVQRDGRRAWVGTMRLLRLQPELDG